VPTDDEFRKVAEDIRALGRALGRDIKDAVDQARQTGDHPGDAVRQSIRDIKNDAKRTYYQQRPHPGWGWGPCGWNGGHHHGRARRWAPPNPDEVVDPEVADPDNYEGGAAGSSSGGGQDRSYRQDRRGRPWGPPGPPAWAGANWGNQPPHHHPRRARLPLPPVRRRWDASTLFGLLVVVFGVGWLISAVGVVHPSVEGIVALGLMLLGAALVVTARTDWSLSRRHWPVWLGFGLIVVLVGTSSTFGVTSAFNNVSFGNKSATATPGTGTIHGGFGDLTVTLPSKAAPTVKVVSIAGETSIESAGTVNINLTSHLVAGQICVNGQNKANGLFPEYDGRVTIGQGSPTQTVTLDVHQMFGEILIGGQNCSNHS
jgi:hypothetical protein